MPRAKQTEPDELEAPEGVKTKPSVTLEQIQKAQEAQAAAKGNQNGHSNDDDYDYDILISERTITYRVPGKRDFWIVGPAEFDFDQGMLISALSRYTDEKGKRIFDPALEASAIVNLWLNHEDTYWNLRDKNGVEIDHNPEVVRKLHPKFKEPLVMFLYEHLYPDQWAEYEASRAKSAEGNEGSEPPSNE